MTSSLHTQPRGVGDRLSMAGAWLQDYATAVRNGSFKPFSATERKVRAATRNKPWGPTGTELNQLAELTYSPADCHIIMSVLAFRLGYPPEKWRNVYKALTVLEFVLKRGSDEAVGRARALAPTLEGLRRFAFVGSDGRDLGANVQHRSAAILALLGDEGRLAAEREAFQQKRKVYAGFSRDQMVHADATSGEAAQPRSPVAGAAAAAGAPDPGSDPASSTAALRNAGETKGVSMEANARHLAALKRLLDRPENRSCADCGPGASASAARSSWASINTGTFLCMRCAGIHRGLGVHVSKVRSCSLDTWLPEQVEFMAHAGNAVANAYWEARLGGGAEGRPCHASLAEQEAFTRRKYVGREWADGAWPPAQPYEDDDIRAILAELRDGGGGAGGSGAPAAGAGGAGEAAPPPAPAAAPALIDLLDLDAEPLPAEAVAAAEAEAACAAAADPLRGLEEVFGSGATPLAAAEAAAPLAPAADLRSWDVGARLSAATEAAAAAAAPRAPPVPAPPAYCPPWAPNHPEQQALATWQHSNGHGMALVPWQWQPGGLAIVPAGQAYDQQHFQFQQHLHQHPAAAAPSSHPFYQPFPALPAPTAAAAPQAAAWPGQPPSAAAWPGHGGAAASAPAAAARPPVPPLQLPQGGGPPATPPAAAAGATPPSTAAGRRGTPVGPTDKADDMLRGSLDSFLSHSEKVSARKASPRPAPGSASSSQGASLSALKQQVSPGQGAQASGAADVAALPVYQAAARAW